MKLETVVPFFPGFYGTILDSYIDQEVEMSMEETGETFEVVNSRCDYRAAMVEISKQWLNRFNAETGFNLEFQALESPREYNFATDKIIATVSLEEVDKARKICEEHPQEFQKFLSDTFTSFDGFISYYPNDADDEDWSRPTEYLDPVEVMTFLAVASTIEVTSEELKETIEDHSSVYEAAQHVWK